MSEQNEQIVWQTSPSQWTNLKVYFFCFLGCLTVVLSVVAIPVAIWYYLVTKNNVYTVTTQRIKTSSGVFSKNLDDLEIYRIKDTRMEKPFWLRIFGLGNIVMVTSDALTPQVTLLGLSDVEQKREQLRALIERNRRVKGVREFD